VDAGLFWNPSFNFENVDSNGAQGTIQESNNQYFLDTSGSFKPNEAITFREEGRTTLIDSEKLGWIQFNQRFTGTFFTSLVLDQFPYDIQFMELIIDSSQWDLGSPGYSGMRFFPSIPLDQFIDAALGPECPKPQCFKVDEWNVLKPRGEVRLIDHFYSAYNLTYSWMEVRISLQRDPTYYINKLVSGSVLLVFMSTFIYALALDVTDRMMGSITCFLALVSFVFVAAGSLPKVAGLTRIDIFFSFSFFMVFLMMTSHAILYLYREHTVEDDERHKAAQEKRMKGLTGGTEMMTPSNTEKKEGESKEEPKKEEKKEEESHAGSCMHGPCGFLGLPAFSTLSHARKADVFLSFFFMVVYSIGVAVIMGGKSYLKHSANEV